MKNLLNCIITAEKHLQNNGVVSDFTEGNKITAYYIKNGGLNAT